MAPSAMGSHLGSFCHERGSIVIQLGTGETMKGKKETVYRLMDAMEMLLTSKPYADITIGDISSACGLARTNFYKHFENKEDMCQRLIKMICTDCIVPQQPYTWESIVREYLNNLNEKTDVFQAMIQGRLSHARIKLFTSIYEPLFDMYCRMIKYRKGMELGQDTIFLVKTYCIGCIYPLTILISEGKPIEIEKLLDLFKRGMPLEIQNDLLGCQFPAEVSIAVEA